MWNVLSSLECYSTAANYDEWIVLKMIIIHNDMKAPKLLLNYQIFSYQRDGLQLKYWQVNPGSSKVNNNNSQSLPSSKKDFVILNGYS